MGGNNSSGWRKRLHVFLLVVCASSNVLVFGCISFLEPYRSNSKLVIWQRNTFHMGTADDRTKVTLLFCNKSRRPIEVVEVFLREGENVLGGNGYRNRIKLPCQIEPRSVRHLEFRIEDDDEKRVTNILIRDIKNNEFVIEPGPGRMWIKASREMKGEIVAAGQVSRP